MSVDTRLFGELMLARAREPALQMAIFEFLVRHAAESPELAPLVRSLALRGADRPWSDWTAFCASHPPSDLLDYRELLDERYGR